MVNCVRFCDTIGTSFSVLSVTAPGPALLGPTEAGRKLTRTLNEEVWEVWCQRRGRFGHFASLPDFNDVQGTLEEIRHVFFRPIWRALDSYGALVFVHPSEVKVTPEKIDGFLPQPVLDYPLVTTRAATSLIISGTVDACPNVDIILSHAGGTLPYVGERVITCLAEPSITNQCRVSVGQAQHSMSRFYYDIALSTSTSQLKALLAFTTPDKILYGREFPYAPTPGIYAALLQYSEFVTSDEGKCIGPVRLNQNAVDLLKKHGADNCVLPIAQNPGVLAEPEFGLESNDEANHARGLLR
ncbi:2-amino-3-carboxymuconate-6-semialdehyde decarboxylase [Hypoxylon sp. FL1284]|nr:2-amino-3-carboxymuconate-6-semialdehyde decarboxylase [Hypoxylon sp. FL1284]